MAAELKTYDIWTLDGKTRIGAVCGVAVVDVENTYFPSYAFYADEARTRILAMLHSVRIVPYCQPLPKTETVAAEV